LGRYSDGSAFCFGCHYYERPTTSPFVTERHGKIETTHHGVQLPDDSSTSLDGRAISWLKQYNIGGAESIRAGLHWSPSWEQLLFPFYDEDGILCCVQAKNFNPKRASKAKYYNVGDKSLHATIYGKGDIVVLTEDAVSAMKVGFVEAGYPLLGTSVSRERLAWLADRFKRLVVWLDSDKYREARDIADTAKLLGIATKTVYTDNDPKTYSVEQIKEFLL
jgi:DNA primase